MSQAIDPIPMEIALRIRKMPREAVEELLKDYQLTDEQRERYLKLAGSGIRTEEPPVEPLEGIPTIPNRSTQGDPSRRKAMAALWILGATYRQIGLFAGITPQGAFQLVDKELPREQRATRYDVIRSGEQLEYYIALYKANEELLHELPPLAIANWLVNHTGDPNE